MAGDTVQDCTGLVVLPAGAEPHAHLDKALSGGAAPNPGGDLLGAIQAWHAYWPRLTHDDLVAILDANKIAKARFVGHSLGTLILQHFAAAHPDRIEKLVFIGVNRAPPARARSPSRMIKRPPGLSAARARSRSARCTSGS